MRRLPMLADTQLKRGLQVARQDLPNLRNWYPVAIEDAPGQPEPLLWWRDLGSRRLTAAFFEDSFASQSPQERRVCCTPLSTLADVLSAMPEAVPPSAFIFHVSRCGSTLLTQMLATLPQCIVVSEPPVLDAFFRLHQLQPDRSGGAHTLRRLVAALGHQREAQESHLVVKLDSWHMPWLPWLRSVFPATPCLLLYRHPAQVLASHRRQRGAHMVPGLVDVSRLALDTADLAPGDLDGYGARVLAGVFGAAVAAVNDDVLNTGTAPITLLNYTQLPAVLWTQLLSQLTVPCSPCQLSAIQQRAQFHAKQPGQVFGGDPPPVASHGPAQAAGLDRALASYSALEQMRQPPGSL